MRREANVFTGVCLSVHRGRGCLPWLERGRWHLPWIEARGTYLGREEGVPTLARGRVPTLAGRGGTHLGQGSIRSTCNVVGGIPLVFTQEDCLVWIIFFFDRTKFEFQKRIYKGLSHFQGVKMNVDSLLFFYRRLDLVIPFFHILPCPIMHWDRVPVPPRRTGQEHEDLPGRMSCTQHEAHITCFSPRRYQKDSCSIDASCYFFSDYHKYVVQSNAVDLYRPHT